MIEVRAPGKLFVAGEYAVVEPGEPAVLVAVDRYVTVRLAPSSGRGRLASDQYGHLPVVWRREGDRLVLDREDRPFDYVLATIAAVERLARERGRELGTFDLSISSELDDLSGRKFGLGSSAAVTVAAARALDAFYDLRLSRLEVLKLALLATWEVNPLASGGDVASSLYGGWLAYASPERGWVWSHQEGMTLSDLLARDWPGLAARPLPEPPGARLLVGWTGTPASTFALVEAVQRRRDAADTHYREFVARSRRCVEDLEAAMRAGDLAGAQAAVRRARRILGSLAAGAGVSIETPALRLLCDTAEALGAAAKSSGAGGGDCGIVLADERTDVDTLLQRWEQADIRHLHLRVHGGADGTGPGAGEGGHAAAEGRKP